MRNIKLIYKYDGTNFFGFQRQENKRTIQDEIEKILKYFTGEDINLVSSGRTDKGVHAIKQVSNFRTNSKIPVENFKYIMNRKLPSDIFIINSEEEDERFHARHSAKSRSYVYYLKEYENYNIFDRNYNYYYKGKLDEKKIQEILNPLIGRHDFESFRMTDCSSEHAIRDLSEIKVIREGERIAIYIKATAFVKSMVRIIIGSMINIYNGNREPDYIIKKLKNPNPLDEKLVAPANGLFLYDIEY